MAIRPGQQRQRQPRLARHLRRTRRGIRLRSQPTARQLWRKRGVIAHEDGVTFGQPFGETAAPVTAAGASDVAVGNRVGVKTDWRGYAIVPYATPYRNNSIRLDVESLPDDVDLALTNQSVTPTRGAVSRANFKAHVGKGS